MSSVDDKNIWIKSSNTGLEENLKYLESLDCCYDDIKKIKLICQITEELKKRMNSYNA